ncbi:GNAT family N-acetyltransferase [Echinicola sp. CAU 1574]|uniref:GNAT family N-acetyltransferase n=1 Tax=Echinicola arenosa TaxID=2774144 RepID=A0ABR9AJJ0_9BACT|nr:GNAT family N-acetyltransferase [Echinicola arenosa]MBD8488694.1 GNAT family N-acetyltransferase [Echinicola arenosa]
MYKIREGKKEDLPRIFELIEELAIYEKAPEQVTNTVAMMEEDGFGPNPVYGFFVLIKEATQEIIGTAIYYYRYSTWKGRRLYLEDYIVTEKERGKGAGKLLFERVMKKSLEDNCTGMMWQVLDWNEPAINFYNKYNADIEEGWYNCHLQAEEIREMLN